MKTATKNIIGYTLAVIVLLGGLMFGASSAFAAASLVGGSHPTLRSANYTDAPGTINWYDDGATNAYLAPGEVAALGVYYKNTGTSEATNVRIRINKDYSAAASNHSFSATVQSSNTSPINGNANVSFQGGSEELDFISGSMVLYTNPTNSPATPLGTEGDVFGSGLLIGNVPAGHEGLLVVHYRASQGNNNANVTPIIQTNQPSSVTSSSAVMRGFFNAQGVDTRTWFEYDTNLNDLQNGNGTSTSQVQRGTGSGNISETVSGLSSGTTYYYMACARNTQGNEDCDPYETFQTSGNNNGSNDPVNVQTNNEDNVDEDSAELNGEVTGGDNITVWFVLDDNDSTPSCNDTSIDYTISGNYDDGESFSRTVTGLEADTTYYFRACGENSDGDLDEGSIMSFTTDNGTNNSENVEVQTNPATSIDENGAKLNGEVTNGDNIKVWFVLDDNDSTPSCDDKSIDYTISGNYDDGEDFSKTVSGLDENTTYYFRACGENSDGDLDEGSIRSFRTDDDAVVNNKELVNLGVCRVSSTGISTATLTSSYASDSRSDIYFEYGTSTSFGSRTSTRSFNAGSGTLSQLVSELSPNTQYYCRVVASNDAGTSRGDIGTFRTNSLTIIPGTSNPGTTTRVITLGGQGDLVTLQIYDDEDTVSRGQLTEYTVEYSNISGRDLEEVGVFIKLPKAARFISTTDGVYNRRDHTIYERLGQLDQDEEGQIEISVRIGSARDGEPVVAEAVLAFEDPQEDGNAFLNAIEFDSNTYSSATNALVGGLFGLNFGSGSLASILVILLILGILILAARYIYNRDRERRTRIRMMEAQERAQYAANANQAAANANGYMNGYVDPNMNNGNGGYYNN
jgi:uncharacterized membrane protein